ncbi:GNAT family N-acetyltransferase, partial [Actinoallomurus acaciae]
RALTSAGGREVSVLPATMHQLVDPITRALLLASSVGADPRRLSAALAAMLDARPLPSGRARSRKTLLLAPATGRPIRLHRPGLPFTATETARALALLELARRLDDPCPA